MVKTKHTLYNCQADFHLWSSIHANRKYVDVSNFKQENAFLQFTELNKVQKVDKNITTAKRKDMGGQLQNMGNSNTLLSWFSSYPSGFLCLFSWF